MLSIFLQEPQSYGGSENIEAWGVYCGDSEMQRGSPIVAGDVVRIEE